MNFKSFPWPWGLNPIDWIYTVSVILYVTCFVPLSAFISTGVYILAACVSLFLPNYGKFIDYFDAWMEEDFVTAIPRNSVVITLTVDGDLALDELRSLFKRNVLEAQPVKRQGKNRYPELKQYLTTFMGFRIWKNDPHFRIENHITEKSYRNYSGNSGDLEGNIHQRLHNQTYHKDRSPWEVILIRQVPNDLQEKDNNNDNESPLVSLVVIRLHHTMADGKSILKLLVECLGKKKLTTASPKEIQECFLDKLKCYLMFPFNFLRHAAYLIFFLPQCHHHPWKVTQYWKDEHVKTVVAFGPKLPLADIKQVAKRNGVTTSAVVMSIVSGSIRNTVRNEWTKKVTLGYPLPKPNHPEFLTNHCYLGAMTVPTDEGDIFKRLHGCNREFLRVKSQEQGKHLNLSVVLGGSQMFPLTRLAANQFFPTGITNIAGEEKGFSVGAGQCVDFRMTVGTTPGVAGVTFCALSYKDYIRIAVTGKETVLKAKEAEILALDIAQEFKRLAIR